MSATRTQVYLTEEQRERVDALAAAEGVTMAEIVRRALDAYWTRRARTPALLWPPPSVSILVRPSQAGTSGIVADLLVDTDVFTDHLRGVKAFDPEGHRVPYSVITRPELRAGATAGAAVDTLLRPFREIDVDRAIAERAGEMGRATGVRLPDALIAATALRRGLTLVTRNRRDFAKIKGCASTPCGATG